MPVEHRISIDASPDVIFQIYREVDSWHKWDPDTKQATLDGPFQVGSRGLLTPTQGRTVPMELTVVEPGRRFTVESKIPLFRMRFEHEMRSVAASNTEVVHRVTFSGPLSILLRPLLLKRVNAGLPTTLARLKTFAEARSAA